MNKKKYYKEVSLVMVVEQIVYRDIKEQGFEHYMNVVTFGDELVYWIRRDSEWKTIRVTNKDAKKFFGKCYHGGESYLDRLMREAT